MERKILTEGVDQMVLMILGLIIVAIGIVVIDTESFVFIG